MSREIKFRAWNKRHNVMIYDVQKGEDFSTRLEMKDQKIMQYTGLKDKNGKEIYEGDILAISHGYTISYLEKCKNVPTGVVEWKGYSDGEYIDNVECYMASIYPVSDVQTKDIEVLGNIYENPEQIQEN
jgi:uncharacterized phage protein (TIGR01671 family)